MKQIARPDAAHSSKFTQPASSRTPQQAAEPGGHLAQLAAIMNGSPQVQRLAQLKDDIQHSPRVQYLMELAAEINQGAPAQRAAIPVNDDAGLEHEADVMGARAQSLPRQPAADEASNEVALSNGTAQFTLGIHGTLAQSDRAGDHDCGEVGAQSLKSRQSSPSAQSLRQASGGCSAQLSADPAAGRDEPQTVESPVKKKDAPEPAFGPSSAVAQRAESAAPPPNHTGLPDRLKSGVENLSGVSLDNVKVHYNSGNPAQLNALAYAQGTDIHVGPGQEKHLPHEAWHVVQQAQGRVKPTKQMKTGVAVNDDQRLETEADIMGHQAITATQLFTEPETNARGSFQVAQRVQWGTIGTGLGAAAGLTAAALLTGGVGPVAAGAIYGASALAGGYLGRKIGQAADYSDLKSMGGLNKFQSQHGGSSQGTLAFVHAGDGNYYMIEQETNNLVAEAAEQRGIRYIKQGRLSGYHAEVRYVDWATEQGILKGSVIWVSKPVCGDCADELKGKGVKIKTQINPDDHYHNWKPSSGQSKKPVAEGVKYRGRRSEVDRLLDWDMK